MFVKHGIDMWQGLELTEVPPLESVVSSPLGASPLSPGYHSSLAWLVLNFEFQESHLLPLLFGFEKRVPTAGSQNEEIIWCTVHSPKCVSVLNDSDLMAVSEHPGKYEVSIFCDGWD